VGRNASALENTKALGAHATVALAEQDPQALAAAFTAAAGGPIDVVIDMLWGVPAVGALLALAPRGRLVNLGQSAGETATIPSGAVRGKTAAILGYTNFSVPFEEKKAAFLRMLEHAATGELTLAHDVMPLDKAADAWQAQARSPNQKLVLSMLD
jgi:NADPH:quinone reductase-like Zn-dependent oxidoreductase